MIERKQLPAGKERVLKVQLAEPHRTTKKRALDALRLACLIAREQGGEHTVGGEYSGEVIGHAHRRQGWRLMAASAEYAHQLGARESNRIQARPLRFGALGAQAGDPRGA